MQVKANGIQVYYKIDGNEGAPWVTFITGIANDTTMWDGQIAALAQDFRILRYDLRGHGQTEATNGDYSFPLLMDDLVGLWDAFKIERSNWLDRLMPCCCRAVMTPDFAAIWLKFVEIVRQHGMEGMVEATVQRWFTKDFKVANPQVLDNIRRMIRGTNPLGYYGCIAAFLTLDFSAGLKNITAPTLFVSGADDHLGGPPPIMVGLVEAVPGAHHRSVPNAALIANIQNPDGFNAILSGFLRG